MTMYCWYQTESKSAWHLALASERGNILRAKKPALMTCLDADNDFSADMTMVEIQSVKYLGDYYADFDSESISTAIQQFQKFLVVLKGKGVDLNQLRLYATGGRGFHVFIPMAVFMPKISPAGVAGLPHIYKEMSHALYVDDLDLRVYTSKKGRQFRCANIQRESGTFKVQISASEAEGMTDELYAQLCSAPRNGLPVDPPTLNSDLALLYAISHDKVDKALVKRKSKKATSDKLSRFKGEWPTTMEMVFSGVGIKPGVGWNFLSLQCAIMASELGKSEGQLLTAAEGLINSHEGDSSRYNTPRKRRDDLKAMFRYVNGSPLYEYDPGGIIALLIPEVRANSDLALGDYVPDVPEPTVLEDGTIIEVVPEDEEGPLKLNKTGIFAKVDGELRRICDLGIAKPVSFRKLCGEHIGYEVEVHLDKTLIGTRHLPMDTFTSKSQFNKWTLTSGASMKGTDVQASSLADILRKQAARTGEPTYALEREGVDVILPPGCKDKDGYEIVWATPQDVVSTGTTRYRFHGVNSAEGYSNTDLMLAPELTEDDKGFITDLLSINTDVNIAKMLGWFSAAFLSQLIRRELNQFPILQVFGQAEAGKSATVELMNGLHYYMKKPRQLASSGQTLYPIIVAVATSASIPVVFEEFKPRQIQKHMKDAIQNIFRSSYRGDVLSRGSLGRDKAQSNVTVTDFVTSAPIVFVGEAIDDQTAILARCVVVSLSSTDRKGRALQFDRCVLNHSTMGKIGKTLALAALSMNCGEVADKVRSNLVAVKGSLSDEAKEKAVRATFNLAVAATGIEFMQSALALVYGDHFDARFAELKASIIDNAQASIPKNMAEASKVLDVMSQLSRNLDPQYQVVNGVDYTLSDDGKSMDLKLRPAYAKYVKWQRSLGMEVLFDTESAFTAGMSNYGGTIRRACPDNDLLYDSPKAVIYRLSLEYLDKEGADGFQ